MTSRSRRQGRTARSSKIWQAKLGDSRRRMTILLVSVLAVTLVLGLRCVYVQGLDPAGNANAALLPESRQIPATRGSIFDRFGQVLAESVPAVNLRVDPTIVATNGMVKDYMSRADLLKAQAGPGIIAGVLSAYLGGDYQTYYNQLSTTRTDSGAEIKDVTLKGGVPSFNSLEVMAHLGNFGYDAGFAPIQSPIRQYPNGTVGANLIGYMKIDNDLEAQNKYAWVGGEGLEYMLNTNLAGHDGKEFFSSSPYGRIPTGTSIVEEPQQGISYQLTIDLSLQYMQDQRLKAAVLDSHSRSGVAVVMNVRTGEILALSNYPTFDPNTRQGDPANFGNRALTQVYEPGSVQKVLTMAAVVDQGEADVDTLLRVPGTISSGGTTINDSWPHDEIHLTAAGVIARSSNIGIILLSQQIEKGTLVSYLDSFGLGKPTGINWPEELSGQLGDASMTDLTRDNIAFGQGVSVTAVQEAAAVAAIANGGVYNAPTLIKSATTADGRPVPIPAPASHRVISTDSAATVVRMMESVVATNPGTFDVPGYRTASKSGTAQAFDEQCKCYNGYISSYIGIAPAENPYLLSYVVLDRPASGGGGTTVASPAVRDMMIVALPRYGVPTSTTEPPRDPITW